jgi:hypothetical protein
MRYVVGGTRDEVVHADDLMAIGDEAVAQM